MDMKKIVLIYMMSVFMKLGGRYGYRGGRNPTGVTSSSLLLNLDSIA